MKKKILAVIGIMTITAAMLAGCSSKDVEADAQASTEPTSNSVAVSDTTKAAESTTVAESTTAETTTKKEAAKTTTKAASKATTTPKTTEKQTTKSTTAVQTTKATTKATTKPTTKATVKNVSAKDVQAQVNSYIRSKGVTVDSSLNPSNSGWNVPISGMQDDLNNGYTLNECKYYVNNYIQNMGSQLSMYCYYSGDDFYVCYM